MTELRELIFSPELLPQLNQERQLLTLTLILTLTLTESDSEQGSSPPHFPSTIGLRNPGYPAQSSKFKVDKNSPPRGAQCMEIRTPHPWHPPSLTPRHSPLPTAHRPLTLTLTFPRHDRRFAPRNDISHHDRTLKEYGKQDQASRERELERGNGERGGFGSKYSCQ